MIYNDFQDKKLPLLGFGTMRLPVHGEEIDMEQLENMVAYAMDNGVNYFDTAYLYHSGRSEDAIGKVLRKYPRESFYLADKFPAHMALDDYDPARIFEEQLRRCQVEYFDFYLLHNVYEKSLATFTDPKWGIIDYLKEQKRLGRIKHLGMSTHGQLDMMEDFLDTYGEDIEFCQIQMNYLDWTLQNAKGKYEMLTRRGIPVWVMEPVRGGKLANFTSAELEAARPGASTASWGFRFLQQLPNVKMVLSGMSNMDQMKDNVRTFSKLKPLSETENQLILDIAERMKNTIPCTACRYCVDGCPVGLNIPTMISICNDIRVDPLVNSVLMIQSLPEEKRPAACISCGKCSKVCPQGIDIPKVMKELAERFAKIPSWEDISRKREEEIRKLR